MEHTKEAPYTGVEQTSRTGDMRANMRSLLTGRSNTKAESKHEYMDGCTYPNIARNVDLIMSSPSQAYGQSLSVSNGVC